MFAGFIQKQDYHHAKFSACFRPPIPILLLAYPYLPRGLTLSGHSHRLQPPRGFEPVPCPGHSCGQRQRRGANRPAGGEGRSLRQHGAGSALCRCGRHGLRALRGAASGAHCFGVVLWPGTAKLLHFLKICFLCVLFVGFVLTVLIPQTECPH